MPSTSPPGVCRIPQLTPVAKTGVPHDAPGPGQGPGHGAAKGSDTFGKVFLPGIPTDSWLSTKTLFSKVNPCPSGRIQAVLSPIFVTRETSCHSSVWVVGLDSGGELDWLQVGSVFGIEKLHSRSALKVSQDCGLPCSSPALNQRTRWAELPWVKASGTT